MSILAIDADSITYKACFIAEKTVYDIIPLGKEALVDDYEQYKPFLIETFLLVKDYKAWLKEKGKTVDDFIRVSRVQMQPVSFALQVVGNMLRDIIGAIGAEQTIIYITGDNNFREDMAVMRGYKESRRKKERPVYYEACREYMLKHWNAVQVDGQEADDAVAQMATSCELDDQHCIIATIDKDLNTVAGWKYNYDKKELFYVSDKEAAYNFYTQLLVGDKSDDIPGVPGIGEKTVPKLLAPCKDEYDMYRVSLAAYNEAYKVEKTRHNRKTADKIGEKVLRENANLLHMRRFIGELWTPPTRQ